MKLREQDQDKLLDLFEESEENFSSGDVVREISFESFDIDDSDPPLPLQEWNGLTLKLEILFGSKKISLEDLTNIKESSLILLDEPIDCPVTLTVNGKPFAHGEILAVDDHYGFRLTRFI